MPSTAAIAARIATGYCPGAGHLPCPPWCVDCEHGSDATCDGGVTFHHGPTYVLPGVRGRDVAVTPNRFDPAPDAAGRSVVWLSIRGDDGVDLSPGGARQLGRLLLVAADQADNAARV